VGIPIYIENGKMKTGKGAIPEVKEAVKNHELRVRVSRRRHTLKETTREFTKGQVGPIMGVDRRDTEKQEAEDALSHQRDGGLPDEERGLEAIEDTDRFNAEMYIA